MAPILLRGRATRAALAQGIAASMIFGTIPAAVKWTGANPWTLALFRLAVAASGIWLFAKNRRAIFSHSPSQLARMGLLGITLAAHWTCYLYGIKLSSASAASLALSSFGVFLTLLGSAFSKHRIGPGDIAPLAAALLGALLVLPDPDFSSRATIGFLLAILSAFLFACLPVIHQGLRDVPASHRIPAQYGVALLAMLPAFPASDWNLPAPDWLALLYIGTFGTLLAHTLWAHATTALPAATTSLIYYLHIPCALAVNALFLGERLSPSMLAGGATIIAASVWGVLRQQRMKPETLPAD